MKKCLLISGGEFSPLIYKEDFDLVIACDRGYAHAMKMNIKPDAVIGDFDSFRGDVPGDIDVIRLNPVKDDTDTVSAVRYALDAGTEEIHICCAFGGRFDHSMANVQTAAFIEEHGARAVISGTDTVMYSLKDRDIRIKKINGCYLSIFSLSDKCEGVTIRGTAYTLNDAILTNGYPVGVSNEWTEDEAYISVEKGTAVIIISKKD